MLKKRTNIRKKMSENQKMLNIWLYNVIDFYWGKIYNKRIYKKLWEDEKRQCGIRRLNFFF